MSRLLLTISLFVYAGLFVTKKAGIYISFASDYGADILCLPIILSLSRRAISWLGFVPNDYTLSRTMVFAAAVYVSVVFEIILPRWGTEYVADPFDVVAYFLGAIAYYSYSFLKMHRRLFNRILACTVPTLILFVGFDVNAQELDWDSLSPKEKAEIARQEQMSAARDNDFLNLMDQGHRLFEQKKYLESIHTYEAAAELRPLNVYPPVIIRDIELSMKDTLEVLREQEKLADQRKNDLRRDESQDLPNRESEMEDFQEQESKRQERVDQWEENQRKALARERALKEQEDQEKRDLVDTKGQEVKETSMKEFQHDLAAQYSQGVTQRTYDEGTRKVTERIVVKGETGNEYRRVEHAWGGKFYFKNGSPITEETWNKETGQ